MKYRLWGLLLFGAALAASLTAPLLEADAHTRCHQHLEAPAKTEDQARPDVFSTHLPLVEIDTGGAAIPGKAYYDETHTTRYTTTEDGGDRIFARMDIVDHETTYNHAGDAPTISSKISIHVRGNSSRFFLKSNYAIQLMTEDGLDNPQPLLGMDAHHEWVLHGPFLDETLMRNYMWYNIGGELMDYAPNVRFCELILNGEYRGVYVMLENLTAGDNGARINLKVNAKRSTFTGYLLQLNGGRGTAREEINQFTFYTKRIPWPVEIVYPGLSHLTPEIKDGITEDFCAFEKALHSYDYDHVDMGYRKYIDVQSFVDYFLIEELTCNYDAGALSTYISKGADGKMRMYLWDMNSACDNYRGPVDAEDFEITFNIWYQMLMRDEYFTDSIINRYWELRKTYFDPDYLCQYIDDVAAYLGPAIERNFSVWGYTFEEGHGFLHPEERNPRSYQEAIEQMKDFLRKRIAWLDENIEVLRQYSAESKVKKFNENAN